ncbi:MAG: hypothetical protein ACXVA9_01870 [Bdellovibrionales bacterium]
MIKLVAAIFLVFAYSQTFAAEAPTASAHSDGGKGKHPPLPWTELSIGTATLNQTLDQFHSEHPIGYHASVQSRLGAIHFGVGFLGASHNEQQNAGTYSQVNIGESINLETLNVGLILGNFIILDAGYGYAQMRRSVSNPYATPSSTTNVSANGTGWEAGGSIIPFRTNTTSFGLTYYYFDATGTSYSSDAVNGNTQTQSTAPGKVHSSGSFAGVSVLLNF